MVLAGPVRIIACPRLRAIGIAIKYKSFLFFLTDRVAVIILGIITLIAGVLLSSIPWLDYFLIKVRVQYAPFSRISICCRHYHVTLLISDCRTSSYGTTRSVSTIGSDRASFDSPNCTYSTLPIRTDFCWAKNQSS